ncbi:tetratricopeptide repeat protein [Aestuariispira insulae]|uniref:Tetratricopeptide repeat protein n=1 Tax=Aestuariispira insulae TaxID=1461337 RepID=A0A3D9HDU0_9PROT|nr:tetratricopeptide repeat protein [Aestuariispira insulae]RED47639.1 tetratricopeptide repeat protein [Aestuariispira insulae]
MNLRDITLFLLAALMLVGCSDVKGNYYLKAGEYRDGIAALEPMYRENPADARAAYFLGRMHLALSESGKALPYMEKAVQLKGDSADYRFWLGIAYWGQKKPDLERASYLRALELEPDHLPSSLYLGHNYFDSKQWALALERYDHVLSLYDWNRSALYNRARTLVQLNKDKEAVEALETFLERYSYGAYAIRATSALNALGDYRYRNFLIGNRNLPLKSVEFRRGAAEPVDEGFQALPILATVLSDNASLKLHLVVHVAGDRALARQRVIAVRDYILGEEPDIGADRLLLSWFAEPEMIESANGNITLNESVRFITAVE